MKLHEQRDLLVQHQEEALEAITEMRAHLCSPKFTANEGEDYINIRDVDAMLVRLQEILWQ